MGLQGLVRPGLTCAGKLDGWDPDEHNRVPMLHPALLLILSCVRLVLILSCVTWRLLQGPLAPIPPSPCQLPTLFSRVPQARLLRYRLVVQPPPPRNFGG